MYQIVQTNRTTYLCESSEEKDGKLILTNAYNMPSGAFDVDEMAKRYVKAKVRGHLQPIRLSSQNVESTQELEELDSVLKNYLAQIPLAEKRAKAKAILAEMGELIEGIDQDD